MLPVLVIEQIGPIEAVKRSAELFKHTWGENMIANAGIGIVALVATLVGVIPCLLLVASRRPDCACIGIGLAVAWVIAVQLVAATLTGIFQIALYRFANDGTVPGFDNDKLREVFRPRRRGRRFRRVRRLRWPGGFGGGGFGGPSASAGGGVRRPTSRRTEVRPLRRGPAPGGGVSTIQAVGSSPVRCR